METIIKNANEDLKAKNFSVISVSESQWENTIDVTINAVNHNKYGASIKQAKYLDDIKNIGHWDENGDPSWYSHTAIQRCSSSAISWLIGFAKAHQDISINLIIKRKNSLKLTL